MTSLALRDNHRAWDISCQMKTWAKEKDEWERLCEERKERKEEGKESMQLLDKV